jgi:cellulose synthase operon protein C
MLRPLAMAYRWIDKDEKALEVCRAAVKLGGAEDVLADFRAWLALDLALSGQIEDAVAQSSKIDAVTVPENTRLVLAMTEAVLMVARAGPAGKSVAFAEAKDHLRAAAGACAPRNFPPGSGRAYQKVVRKLASEVCTLNAKLWATWQRLVPWVKG